MPKRAFLQSCCVVIAGFGVLPTSALAAWQPNGIPVAPVGPGIEQFIPNICTDGANGAYVAWKEETQTDPGNGYLQRVTANGEIAAGWPLRGLPIGATAGDEFICNVAPDELGGVYLVWLPNYRMVRILSDGTVALGWPAAGLLLPASATVPNRMDAMCGDGLGGIFVVWTSVQNETFMLHYAANGTVAPGWSTAGRPIIAEASSKGDARILRTAAGGILASWNDSRGGTGNGSFRYALEILPTGDPAPGWPVGGLRINSIPSIIENTFMISDGAAGCFIGWDDNRHGVFPPNPLDYDLYAQHVLGNGTVDARWPADGLPICTAPSAQYFFEMAEDGMGGALAIWDDYRNGPRLYAVRIRPDGSIFPGWTPNGSRLSALETTQTLPQAVSDLNGGVYGFWSRSATIFGQHFDAAGIPATDWTTSGKIIAGGDAAYVGPPIAVSDGKGGALVSYQRQKVLTTGERLHHIYLQRVYPDFPVATRVSYLDQETGPGYVRLRWFASDASSVRSTVYRADGPGEWMPLGSPEVQGQSTLEFEDRDLAAGRYGYRLGVTENGVETFTEETWIEIPSAYEINLAGFQPNPAVGSPNVAFTLADDKAARIDVFDVKGRAVTSREVGGMGPGRHQVRLDNQGPWSPGVYWVRMTSAGRTLTQKSLVTR